MLIYVCSSSHGFGHAARDAAVLQQLRLRRPDWTLVMSSVVEPRFLRLLLGDNTITIRPCRWDVGMVQADALGVDRSQTLAALSDLETALPDQLMGEVEWLRAQTDSVLILGDIPPAAAELADRLDAPLVWMSNFGWDEIYRPLGVAFERWADAALAQYKRGQLLLRCPFDLSMNWELQELALGLVCTSPRSLPSDWERAMISLNRTLVLVGFGGLGLPLDPELFLLWPRHHFLMAPPAQAAHALEGHQVPNLSFLPGSVRPIDAFPLCSRQLGKPGFSTFCEALDQGVGLHVVERRDFAEVAALMDGLRRHGHHRVLTRDQLERGDWQLDLPLNAPEARPLPQHGAQRAADALIAVAEAQ